MSVLRTLASYSSRFSATARELVVILAAGHGKRIKSEKSKMLHEIWGVPTAERIHRAVVKGLPGANTAMVVGVKAEDVARAVGKRPGIRYVYQQEQRGTGHAVQVALRGLRASGTRSCYVLPGDMGLLTPGQLTALRRAFARSGCDMMVLTGTYEGDTAANYYGRIVRAKDTTSEGRRSRYAGMVIEIMEHKDILALEQPCRVSHRGEHFTFSRDELLGLREFNSGVYVFKMAALLRHINRIRSDNAQNEVYLTDLIAMFNRDGLKVGALAASDPSVVLGFNNKSVLKEMEKIARGRAYETLKDIVTFDDPEDFYLADEVIARIVELDRKGVPLDIQVGQGAYVGAEVSVSAGLHLQRNATVSGSVRLGQRVTIGRGSTLATHPGQTMVIGNDVEIMVGDSLNGNIRVGERARIEGGVRITGSEEHPVRIGSDVRIKGTTYIYGCLIDSGVFIEHCFIKQKHVRAVRTEEGTIQPVRFVMPLPEGMDSVREVAQLR
jgi:bifunctional UDP-N-acetylglucosamine pyrophosphorylase / glucosamine-1-phosphate N-acetyltransferase